MTMFRKYLALLAALMLLITSVGLFATAEDAQNSQDAAQPEAQAELSDAEDGGRPGELPEGAEGRGEWPGEPPEGMERGERPERPAKDGSAPEAGEATPDASAEAAQDDASAEDAAPQQALASFEFDGTVVSGVSRAVTTAVGGTVDSVAVRAGQKVEAGDVLASLATEKVYATRAGTVSAVFGAPGDSVDEVAERYGAVMYIEPDAGRYTISADTSSAYSSSDNLYIHLGEAVWLKCYSDGSHTGVGFVSGVSGDSYTVEVTEGEFKVGETVTVFRSADYTSASRLGRGTCARADDVAVGGSGSGSASGGASAGGSSAAAIVAVHVAAGDAVQKGDLLYETLSGAYDAYYCTGSDIVASASGILSELSCSVGDSVNGGARVATIEPVGDLQLQIDVSEADLPFIHEGDKVTIRFNWDDGETAYEGSVFSISYASGSQQADQTSGGAAGATSGTSSGEAVYAAYVSFTPDGNIRLGMTATVAVAQ